MLSFNVDTTKATKERLEQLTKRQLEAAMQLSEKTISTLDKLSSQVVAEVLQRQLGVEANGYSQVGRATGILVRGIKVKLSSIDIDLENHNYIYEYTPDFEEYGGALAHGRKAAYIPIEPLITWIQAKKRIGAWQGDGDKPDKSIAFGISRASQKRFKHAQLPFWYDPSNNKELSDKLHRAIASRRSYYVRLMTDDVKNNLKKI